MYEKLQKTLVTRHNQYDAKKYQKHFVNWTEVDLCMFYNHQDLGINSKKNILEEIIDSHPSVILQIRFWVYQFTELMDQLYQ